jgi:hypothetical protein
MTITCSKCTFEAATYYILQKHIDKDHHNIEHICDNCNKKLASADSLNKHKTICNGLSSLQCKYCYAYLASRLTKCRHLKVCPCRPDDTNINTTEQPVEEAAPTVTTIIFEMRVSKCTQFITSHITTDDMKSIIFDYYNEKKKYRHLFVFVEYAKRILKHPDNRCIIKPNIKILSSKIHCGNGEWERYADDDVIEKLRIDIAKSFMKQLEDIEDESKYILTKRINALRGELEFLTDDVFDDEHKVILKEAKYVHERIMNFVLAR